MDNIVFWIVDNDLYKEDFNKNITEYKKYKINDTKTNIEITTEELIEKTEVIINDTDIFLV